MIDLIFIALMQAAAGEPAQAPAADASATQTQQSQQASAQPEQHGAVRCRREIVTGTRLTRRVCMTDAERQQIEDDSREQLQHMQRPQGIHEGG